VATEVSKELTAHIVRLLRAAKNDLRITQNALARKIEIPTGSLSAIMGKNAKKGVGHELLPKFAKFFKKTEDELAAEAQTQDA
jgi:hypothetical protein